MSDLSHRITDLSPERRRLFEQLLEPRAREQPARRPGPPVKGLPPTVAPQLRPVTADALDPKAACRTFYDDVSMQLDASVFGQFSFFLNYGYVSGLTPAFAAVPLPDSMLNRNSVRLVLEVLEDCVTPSSLVLDVGCGRGGTISVITQFFRAHLIVGLDLSGAAVAFSHRTHRHPGVALVQGDSEVLPFPDAAFDVVTNIESSSCYPDLGAFYAEVARVLRPGGWFLYADCLPAERHRQGVDLLERLHLKVERDRDITPNVLLSCDEIARSRVGAYGGGNEATMLNDFLGAPGSQYYEEMRARRWAYRIYKLRRAAPVRTA